MTTNILNYKMLCPSVCHMMSTHNFSEARAVTELNI